MDLSKLIDFSLLTTFFDQFKAQYADKKSVSAIESNLKNHIANSNVHVSADDKAKWNDACEIKPYIRIKSSTDGSTKIFKIVVDDDGLLTGEEEV